ncbi:hypothetical protein XELAEV_18009490mg [Xenopus laevis]|uniref:Uncharacterized protein n=1 Tax=Xenopus laevis TaxID=8355 RepID=A0A974DUK4_XENLA|nr:hypothetical protein XELAEV_18009490mg [Xenopus laevis]
MGQNGGKKPETDRSMMLAGKKPTLVQFSADRSTDLGFQFTFDECPGLCGLCEPTKNNTTYTETGPTTDDSIYTTLSQMSIASTVATSIVAYSTEMATSLTSEEHSTSKPVVTTTPTSNTTLLLANSTVKETTLSETTSADTSTNSTGKTDLSVPMLSTTSPMTPSAAPNITDTAPSTNLSTVSSSNSTDNVTGSELTSAPTASDLNPSTMDVTSSITEVTKVTQNPSETSSTVDTKETTIHQIASEATKSPFTISTSQKSTSKKVTATSEATTDVGIGEPRALSSGKSDHLEVD